MGGNYQPFLNVQLAFTRQAMTSLEVSLVVKVRGHARSAMADIVLSRPEVDGCRGDNPLVDFVRRISGSEMMLY